MVLDEDIFDLDLRGIGEDFVKDVRLDGFGINFENVNFFETKPGQFAAEFFGAVAPRTPRRTP